MQFSTENAGGFDARRPVPPPLWFVTNGEKMVGPVTTNLLLRGVAESRVPHDCWVRERTWRDFRPLDRIREVAALRRKQAEQGIVRVERTRWKPLSQARAARTARFEQVLGRAHDIGELFLLALDEAMRETGARVGAVHRMRAPFVGLVTSAVAGPCMTFRLGHVLPDDDPALAAARAGRGLSEKPRDGKASGAVRERLGPPFASGGVATLPLAFRGRVYALFELGRADHEFRRTDLQALCDIADAAEHQMTVVRNR